MSNDRESDDPRAKRDIESNVGEKHAVGWPESNGKTAMERIEALEKRVDAIWREVEKLIKLMAH